MGQLVSAAALEALREKKSQDPAAAPVISVY